ncbi:MAG: hypothetical protein GXC73_14850 [Chitinophagaceae bacterium]|nr:hypothetical protein [Chitinophagaceae bacterium]
MKPYKFNLSELKHYNSSLIRSWLSVHNTNSYLIKIDWEMYDEPEDLLQIVLNYTSAAYAAELLSQCAQTIQYNTPLPQAEPFMFQLSNCDKKKLSKKLAVVVDGYFSYDEGMTRFSILANQYFLNVLDGNMPTHVPALIKLAEQHLP